MDNQHQKIKGYRDLSQAEIDLMNEIKAMGEQLQALCTKLDSYLDSQYGEAGVASAHGDCSPIDRLLIADPVEWLWEGKHDLQTGIMKLVRSVAQPTTF